VGKGGEGSMRGGDGRRGEGKGVGRETSRGGVLDQVGRSAKMDLHLSRWGREAPESVRGVSIRGLLLTFSLSPRRDASLSVTSALGFSCVASSHWS
jgi:hypothetical protein